MATVITDALREQMRQASMPLMDALRPKPGETYTLRSRSRGGRTYEMIVTPEGFAVHNNEGCEGEIFNGPLNCWHAKTRTPTEEEMTTAVSKYEAGAVTVRGINEEDKAVLKATICRGASDAELDLFVATCQHTGLDPFMKQIHAVMRNTKVGDKWEKVMSIQIGVDGYRLIAQRTGLTEGMDGPLWSPDGVEWYDFPHPDAQYAKVGIWRKGTPRAFTAICRMAAYVQDNHMWKTMGPEQLAKCAEVLGLRRAYPAEMSALAAYTGEPEYNSDPDDHARAGVPEGAYRELATEQPAVQTPPRPAPPPAPPTPAPERDKAVDAAVAKTQTPTTMLNAIAEAHGLGAKQAALAVMPRLFDTMIVTKLTEDQRADYMAILEYRLINQDHEHEGAYTAQGKPICRLCGEEVAGPEGSETDAETEGAEQAPLIR
jgi:phage recombination protein Bet